MGNPEHPCELCNRPTPVRYQFCRRCYGNAQRLRLNLAALFPKANLQALAPPRRPQSAPLPPIMLTTYCGNCRRIWKADGEKDARCECGNLVSIGRRRETLEALRQKRT